MKHSYFSLPARRSRLAAALLLAAPAAALHAQPAVSADPGAARQPTLASTNGTPVVNIAAPDRHGLSHNRYTDFNVGPAGLILNNAAQPAGTALGGTVQANPHFNGQAATVILNEVSGRAASRIEGALEVAGQRARVIIANPNGISADGARFINASRVSLVAGRALLDEQGRLAQFATEQGRIDIAGRGLDASSADTLDLVARSLRINAAVQAATLNAYALRGETDANLASSRSRSGGEAPAIAIDVAQLGSMHANSIRLVGQSAGVGVNVAGKLQAMAGDISVSSTGRLRVADAGEIVAGRRLSVAGGLSNDGLVRAGSISVAGGLDNAGAIRAAGALSQAGSVANRGEIHSGGALSIAGGQVSNHGSIRGDSRVTLSAGSLLNAQGASITSAGRLTRATGSTLNSGLIAGYQAAAKPMAPVQSKPPVQNIPGQGQTQRPGTASITVNQVQSGANVPSGASNVVVNQTQSGANLPAGANGMVVNQLQSGANVPPGTSHATVQQTQNGANPGMRPSAAAAPVFSWGNAGLGGWGFGAAPAFAQVAAWPAYAPRW